MERSYIRRKDIETNPSHVIAIISKYHFFSDTEEVSGLLTSACMYYIFTRNMLKKCKQWLKKITLSIFIWY